MKLYRYNAETGASCYRNIEVRGNWWDMDFEVYQNGEIIGAAGKMLFTWGDSCQLQIGDDEMEPLLVALDVAIDSAKAAQAAAAAGG